MVVIEVPVSKTHLWGPLDSAKKGGGLIGSYKMSRLNGGRDVEGRGRGVLGWMVRKNGEEGELDVRALRTSWMPRGLD